MLTGTVSPNEREVVRDRAYDTTILVNPEFSGAANMQYLESRFEQDQWHVNSGIRGIAEFLKAHG